MYDEQSLYELDSRYEDPMDERFGEFETPDDSCLNVFNRTDTEGLSPYSFDDNACVLINNKGDMIGTRVNGIVAAELKDIQGGAAGSGGRWGKILGLAGKVSFFLFYMEIVWLVCRSSRGLKLISSRVLTLSRSYERLFVHRHVLRLPPSVYDLLGLPSGGLSLYNIACPLRI
jgi:hypothetical protein